MARQRQADDDLLSVSKPTPGLRTPPTAHELTLRRRAVARLLHARATTPPLDITTAEMVRRAREESAKHDG